MTSKHINTYTALTCKYTQLQNRQKKAQDMGLFDLHQEEFKLFAMEYKTVKTETDKKLDHYVNSLQRSKEDYDPGIKDMFLNNLDPTFYAMQMQNPDVLTHTQMKRQMTQKKSSRHKDQKSKV
jgi:hypothetical protein